MRHRPGTVGVRGHRRPLARAARERRGVVLVFFALFLVATFGLFAVIADLGIARLTQQQMQASADVAALEGLAGRDAVVGDTGASDAARREAASLLATLVFDEDLDPATANQRFVLGAGPILETGVGGVDDPAGGVLTSSGPWIPSPATNVLANAASGDLVAGTFTALDPANPGRVDWHVEASNYARADFTTDPQGTAFLARLRRTRGDAPLDRVPGESTAAPTLPFLFGLGSALSASDPGTYDPRRDGITVRATAIADARRAMIVGLARPGLPGLAPLASDASDGSVRWMSVEEGSWSALPAGGAFSVSLDAIGTISGSFDGRAVGGSQALGGLLTSASVSLPSSPSVELDGLVFAAVHAVDPATAGLRVRGFVALEITAAAIEAGPTLQLTGTKLGQTIAPANASAQRMRAVDLDFASPSPAGPQLLAPVLAR